MSSSSTIRSFIQDFLNPKFTINQVIERWNGVSGIYDAIKSGIPALNMFGIRVDAEKDLHEIFLCLSNDDQRQKQHRNFGLFVYPSNKVRL